MTATLNWVPVTVTGVLGLAGIAAAFFAPTWTQRQLEQRRERREFRQAKRLVSQELRRLAAELQTVQRSDPSVLDGGDMLRVDAWESHKATLASAVTDDAWDAVEKAYAHTAWVRRMVVVSAGKTLAPRELERFMRHAAGAMNDVAQAERTLEHAQPEPD